MKTKEYDENVFNLSNGTTNPERIVCGKPKPKTCLQTSHKLLSNYGILQTECENEIS